MRFIALSLGQMKLTHAIYMLNTLYMLLMSELSGSYRGGLGNVRNTRCEVKGAEKKCLLSQAVGSEPNSHSHALLCVLSVGQGSAAPGCEQGRVKGTFPCRAAQSVVGVVPACHHPHPSCECQATVSIVPCTSSCGCSTSPPPREMAGWVLISRLHCLILSCIEVCTHHCCSV